MKEDKFPYNRKPSHRRVGGKIWNYKGQHRQEKKKKSLTNITSGEVAQKLTSASSKWGLGREA